MTVNVVVLSSRIEAAPGDFVDLPLRLTNTADTPASCRITIVGLDPADDSAGDGAQMRAGGRPGYDVIVPAGETVEVLSPVAVPWALGMGDHTAAVEIDSDRPGDRPVLIPFVIAIGSVARVELLALPSTMRGHRRAKFKLDVLNNEPVPVDLVISAEAPEVQIRFSQPAMRLQPGERALTKAQVRGPRHWRGEPTQHNLVITASGRASSTSTTAAYIQRPWFAHRARMLLAGITVVALWLAAIGGAALWLSNRSDDENADGSVQAGVVAVDTDGDGVADQFTLPDGTVITGVDTDGDGKADAFFDAAGNPVGDPTADGGAGADGSGSDGSGTAGDETADGTDGTDGGSTAPTSALLRGTVSADGDSTNITITLTPIALGETPDPAAIQGFVGPQQSEATKIWSARALPPGAATLNPIRQTEAVAPLETTPETDGVWQIPNVALRHSYEIVFAKPGFDTQSFVVTPPEDGAPVELDVKLVPATGAIGGTVRGPNGPLGGAEIVVTDGVLTFKTTAATVGAVGTWSIDQVSTPGVYTVSATLTGYGTEVRQVTLSPGGKFPTADLTMQRGVGSVSGRVTGPDGQPIGGVTITATNGDESRTTSSLTEGDIGSYNIPQLTIGATFTLLVTAPGYLDESRRTPVNGAQSGIDFGLTKTTLTLTGTVTSGTTGVGVANAGLTLTTGDLTFRASTAGGANRGTFAIDDLPPGNYTVTVDHYQHISSTQLITLTAGVPPPPLDIALEKGTGLPALGTGTVVVEVVDPSGKTAESRQIKNATVRLVRTQTGEELPATTQEAFNFLIPNVPIGTYTLLVTAPRYNPAPARQVSVGLSQSRVEVQMQRLGQASGYVVDSLTNAKLVNYFVNIYRQPESPGDAPIYVLQGDANTGLWQTPPDSLVPGTYRIDIPDSSSPPGYLVRNDQVLDPAVVGVGAERDMKFVVPEGSVDPVTVGSIQADPYPSISGRVYRASMPPDSVEVKSIDSADLAVTLSCPDAPTFTAKTYLDDDGVRGSGLNDSFLITKQEIDNNNLTGTCILKATAGSAYAPNPVTLTGVEPSDGVTSSDRRVHVVLSATAPSIGGSVFWMNGTSKVPISNAGVASTRPTSFSVVENPALSSPPTPVPTSAATTSNSLGNWTLDGQLIGVAPYVFTAPDFGNATIDIRVDPTGATSATAGPGAALVPTVPDDGQFHVRMAAPTPRTLTGNVTVLTTGTADLSAVHITAKSPTCLAAPGSCTPITETTVGATTIERLAPVGNTLPFKIHGAEPGTWEISVNEPAHIDVFGASVPVTKLVNPGPAATEVPGFDMSLVTLGSLSLALTDGNGTAITTAPTIELDGTTYPSTFVPAVGGASPVPAHFLVTDIPVDATTPLAAPGKPYTMRLTLSGYDTTAAQALTVNVRAGQETQVPFVLPKFGTITGDVEGIIGGVSNEVITLCDPQVPQATYDACLNGKVEASPVDELGNPAVAGASNYGATPTVAVSANHYTISGPAGYYKLNVTHPQYGPQTLTGSVVPGDNFTPAVPTPPASAASGVLRIVNDDANEPAPFQLQVIRGILDLNVYRTLPAATGVPVTTAQYTLTPTSNPVSTGPIDNDTPIDNLFPGSYQLQVREFRAVAPFDEIAFPVITNIVINKADPLTGAPSVTTVEAPLPLLAPSITGEIQGRNSNGQPILLPATAAAYTVTGNFDQPVLNGEPIVPDPAPGSSTATINTGAASTGTVAYSFTNVAVGEHQLTLSVDPTALKGYTLAPGTATQTLTVLSPGTTDGPDFQLTVKNVDFKVTLRPGDYPSLRSTGLPPTGMMRLESPNGEEYGNFIADPTSVTFDDATDTITFANVAPETGNFLLDVVDDLHLDLTDSPVQVAPDLDGDATFVSSDIIAPLPSPNTGRVMGAAQQRDSSIGAPSNLAAGATITITRTSAAGDCAAPCNVPFSGGQYSYDLAPGSYEVATAQTDYQTQRVNVNVTGGVIITQDVSISKLATVAFTVNNVPLPTGTTVALSDGVTNYPSTTSLSGAKTVYTFKVPAQTPTGVQKHYVGTANAPGFGEVTLPAVGDTYAPQIGSATSASITLAPRTFTVDVTTPGAGALPADLSVIARFGGAAFPGSGTTPPFEFSSASIPTLPISGTGNAVADGTGFRANSAVIPDSTAPTVNISILPTVTVTGTVTKPSGLAALPAGTKVTATAPGMASIEATVAVDAGTGNGSYSMSGLDLGLDLAGLPQTKTWTITYDAVGVGKHIRTTDVSSTSSTAVTLDLVPVPQTIPVTFNVKAANPSGAVTIVLSTNPASPNVTVTPTAAGANGTPVINLPETLIGTPVTYTVDGGTGYIAHPGGTITPTTRSAITEPVTIVKRPPITGTVVGGTPAAGVDNAKVRICPVVTPTPANCTNSTQIVNDVNTNNSGAFTFNALVPQGTYHVWADKGSNSGYVVLTVNADRSFTLSNTTITLV